MENTLINLNKDRVGWFLNKKHSGHFFCNAPELRDLAGKG